jgi:tetratricopeptide (TPR) repeat protein
MPGSHDTASDVPTMSTSKVDFFISFTQADRHWAEWVDFCLREAGYSTFVQFANFRAGHNFVKEMHEGLSSARRVIGILSPRYLESRLATAEWMSAFSEDPLGEQRKLIFVQVENCDLAGLLPNILAVNIAGLSEEEAKAKLLTEIQPEPAPSKGKLPFPTSVPVAPYPPTFPGVWHVPILRKPYFLGREKILSDLAEFFSAPQHNRFVVVTGLGGAGKTRVAVEYCHLSISRYKVVWWIDASVETQLHHGLVQLAKQLHDVERLESLTIQELIPIVATTLKKMPGLLVFDNAENPDLLKSILTGLTNTHALITSRNPFWSDVATVFDLPPLDRGDAISFVIAVSKDVDEIAANHLCEQLGNLPIALEQAALYIRRTACGIKTYSKRFEQRRSESKSFDDDAEKVIARVWELSLSRLFYEDIIALMWLRGLAFLGPHPIPRQFFDFTPGLSHKVEVLAVAIIRLFRILYGLFVNTEGMSKKPAKQLLSLENSFDSLQRYGLIEINQYDVSLHPLVRSVVRSSVRKKATRKYVSIAISLLKQLSSDTTRLDQASRLWCLHVADVGKMALQAHVSDAEVVHILVQAGKLVIASSKDKYAEGKRLFEQALSVAEELTNERFIWQAICLLQLTSVCRETEYAAAAGHVREAIESLQLSKDPPVSLIVTAMSEYGALLLLDYDTWNAGKFLEAAIEIQRKEGKDLILASLLDDYSEVLRSSGEYKGAEAAALEALSVATTYAGLDHSNGRFEYRLGKVQSCMGKIESARKNLQTALDICRKAFGEESPYCEEIKFELNSLENHHELRLQTARIFTTPREPDVVAAAVASNDVHGSGPVGEVLHLFHEKACEIAFDNVRRLSSPVLMENGYTGSDQNNGERLFDFDDKDGLELRRMGQVLSPLILPIYQAISSDPRWNEEEEVFSFFRDTILEQYSGSFRHQMMMKMPPKRFYALPKPDAPLKRYMQVFQKHAKDFFEEVPECFRAFETSLREGRLGGERRGIHGMALKVDADYYRATLMALAEGPPKKSELS